MKTGFGAVKKSISDAKARQSQGFSGRLNYFNWKDGETKVLRFLTDEVLLVAFYEMVVDNQGHFKDFIVAPDLYEEDPSWRGEDWVLKYRGRCHENGMSGPLVEPTPRVRSVGVAVWREEAPREAGGQAVAYQDYLHEINVGGQIYPARWFGVVKQSLQLFWDQMGAYYDEYGTICDRDYKIKRTGKSLDTSYSIIPRPPDPDFDIKALQESYGYGRSVDAATKDDPERFLYCPQTVTQWAEQYASEDRAKYWLADPRAAAQQPASNGYTPSGTDEFDKDTTHNPHPEADEAQVAPAPRTDFADLRARLERHT
jgi:hypothetical protein